MKKFLTILGVAAVSLAGMRAQVLFTGSYSQNFNSLGTSNVSWGNNTTLLGWTINSESFNGIVTAGNGSGTGGLVYNYGTNSSTDRSLGYIGSNSNDWTNFYLQIQNTTGSTITELSISYDGRLWRSGGTQTSNSNNTIQFFYATGSPTLVNSSSTSGWQSLSALDYAPSVTVSAGTLTGASTAIASTINGLSLAAGETIYLRWMGNNGSGTDAGLAIDNVSIAAIPEPATWAMIGLGSVIVLRRMRRRVEA